MVHIVLPNLETYSLSHHHVLHYYNTKLLTANIQWLLLPKEYEQYCYLDHQYIMKHHCLMFKPEFHKAHTCSVLIIANPNRVQFKELLMVDYSHHKI